MPGQTALAMRAVQHYTVSNDRTPAEALANMKDTGTLHVTESDAALVDVMIMPPAPAVC